MTTNRQAVELTQLIISGTDRLSRTAPDVMTGGETQAIPGVYGFLSLHDAASLGRASHHFSSLYRKLALHNHSFQPYLESIREMDKLLLRAEPEWDNPRRTLLMLVSCMLCLGATTYMGIRARGSDQDSANQRANATTQLAYTPSASIAGKNCSVYLDPDDASQCDDYNGYDDSLDANCATLCNAAINNPSNLWWLGFTFALLFVLVGICGLSFEGFNTKIPDSEKALNAEVDKLKKIQHDSVGLETFKKLDLFIKSFKYEDHSKSIIFLKTLIKLLSDIHFEVQDARNQAAKPTCSFFKATAKPLMLITSPTIRALDEEEEKSSPASSLSSPNK